jgi:hypothetical protein
MWLLDSKIYSPSWAYIHEPHGTYLLILANFWEQYNDLHVHELWRAFCMKLAFLQICPYLECLIIEEQYCISRSVQDYLLHVEGHSSLIQGYWFWPKILGLRVKAIGPRSKAVTMAKVVWPRSEVTGHKSKAINSMSYIKGHWSRSMTLSTQNHFLGSMAVGHRLKAIGSKSNNLDHISFGRVPKATGPRPEICGIILKVTDLRPQPLVLCPGSFVLVPWWTTLPVSWWIVICVYMKKFFIPSHRIWTVVSSS